MFKKMSLKNKAYSEQSIVQQHHPMALHLWFKQSDVLEAVTEAKKKFVHRFKQTRNTDDCWEILDVVFGK